MTTLSCFDLFVQGLKHDAPFLAWSYVLRGLQGLRHIYLDLFRSGLGAFRHLDHQHTVQVAARAKIGNRSDAPIES
jgi:hypothetical protein